jgi:hypothetical protein
MNHLDMQKRGKATFADIAEDLSIPEQDLTEQDPTEQDLKEIMDPGYLKLHEQKGYQEFSRMA